MKMKKVTENVNCLRNFSDIRSAGYAPSSARRPGGFAIRRQEMT